MTQWLALPLPGDMRAEAASCHRLELRTSQLLSRPCSGGRPQGSPTCSLLSYFVACLPFGFTRSFVTAAWAGPSVPVTVTGLPQGGAHSQSDPVTG